MSNERGAARFDWIHRMGVHEAYHQSRANRLIHWVCIPLELFAAAKALSLVTLGPVDLALVAVAALGALYVAAEIGSGLVTSAILLLLWLATQAVTTGSGWADLGVAVALFAAAFTVQTRVGHGVFERGLDDTEQNLAELRRTRNPIPILLIFHYHLVELLFAAGYRPSLRRAVEEHTREERQRTEASRRATSAA